MEHAVIFQDYIGLPSTDNPCIGEKVAAFKFPKMRSRPKQKLFPIERAPNFVNVNINTSIGG